jgi:ribosomal protein S18 acetylase RimI-like enzyme
MPQTFSAEPARPEERAAALRLVFQHLAPEDRVARVANALTLIVQGDLDPQGITVVRRGADLLGAMVSMRLAGAGGLVWPPQVKKGVPTSPVEDALVRQACLWLRQGGTKVAQALLPAEEAPLADPLLRHGFRHVTRLWYMRHGLGGPRAEPAPPTDGLGLHFQDYPHCDPLLFQDTLLRTYLGTLDCPELNGVREVEEILEGHRHQGKYDPQRWQLLFRGEAPVGILLLAEMPDWAALDISFLGVVPEARGAGLGRVLTAHALAEGRRAGVSHVTLAVDCRNLPAWKLYREHGFVPHERREVYLALWPEADRPRP